MEHILDYETLKEWGFIWATGRDGIVTSYLKQKSTETDAHGFRPITLTMYPHPNLNIHWIMSYLDADSNIDTLFRGRITSKTVLKCILKSCI
ncbi:MAG: hypothetical protein ACJARG_000041 [Arcticibacterium sp.]|jgi:hypothetical protein